ncbi:hypothetical protein C8R45DRAFT_1111088 [Mycena sanguinolenta]|nr:hypothetical protein C8R45DRAFT_1111088 [Mycena sanguinolenta]
MSALFTPLKLGSTTISNRIGMAALTRSRSTDTVPNEVMLKYYVQRAKGGAGLIVSEGILITRQGCEWQFVPGIWDGAQTEGWKKITDAVHEAGSKIYAQLWHVGRAGHPDCPEQIAAGVPVYAPSAIAARGGKFRFLPGQPGFVTPTESPRPYCDNRTMQAGAINAKKAGFDGVEFHAANGYLVRQFLDSTANHRTDKWGGSPENRTRFALETIKECLGPRRRFENQPESGGYKDVGMPLKDTVDTFGHLLLEANKLGLSYVTLVRSSIVEGVPFPTPSLIQRLNHNWIQTSVKRAMMSSRRSRRSSHTPVFVNAGVTPSEAEELVKSGKAAGVFFGLNWITHPDVVRRIKEGKELDNAPDWHGAEGVDPALGYLDYKEATYQFNPYRGVSLVLD